MYFDEINMRNLQWKFSTNFITFYNSTLTQVTQESL